MPIVLPVDALLAALQTLPPHWALVAVGGNKAPYKPNWQKAGIPRPELEQEIRSGRAQAVGVLAGPLSGGLLCVDHDGSSATAVLAQLGLPLRELPRSWMVTSGRLGRFQILYSVPEAHWSEITTAKFKSGVADPDGKPEQLELRWSGCQSVVIGVHPRTGRYRWLPRRSPLDLPLAAAPELLLAAMRRGQRPSLAPSKAPEAAAPLLSTASSIDAGSGEQAGDVLQWARRLLPMVPAGLADDYDSWVQVGMALHSTGRDELLGDWDAWSRQSGKYESGQCERKWRSFSGESGISIGTLFHLAGRPRLPGRGSAGRSLPGRRRSAAPSAAVASTSHSHPSEGEAGDGGLRQRHRPGLIRLEADQLLRLLRQHYRGRLRFNTFSRRVELDGSPIEDIEIFYLHLAEQGYQVMKDLTIDAVLYVARLNAYDPVREYLERVEREVPPLSLDNLASSYLRPGDPGGTLYDAMLRHMLIAGVRRVFEPGCKHDSACVIAGDQGCGKSTFWRVLADPWFSDALMDISSKDDLMVLHAAWLMEWAELDHITGRKHAGQVKAFLSRQSDLFRAPYDRSVKDYPRRGIIVGTTNRSEGFLVDDTGNRRFWVIPTTCTRERPIDIAGLQLERDAIWAAAMRAFRDGEPNHLPVGLAEQVEQENSSYLVAHPWRAVIVTYLQQRTQLDPLTTEEILSAAIDKPIERQSRVDQMVVGQLLGELGYQRIRRRVAGQRRWIYLPLQGQ